MRDDSHGYAGIYAAVRPLPPYDVIERIRDQDGRGKRTDTVTFSLRYALERRDVLRRQKRPTYVTDREGRRVEAPWP